MGIIWTDSVIDSDPFICEVLCKVHARYSLQGLQEITRKAEAENRKGAQPKFTL